MSRDRSLDEFLDAGDPSDGEEAGPDPDGESDPAGTDDDPEGRTAGAGSGEASVLGTYEWTPGGATCDRCGTVSTRRWRGDAVMVCPGCKEW